MKRPMIEKIKSRLHSALNNAKYLTTGNLAHNKACVEMMVEASLNDIDQIVVETRECCIQRAQLRECKRCKDNDKCWLCDDCTIMQDVREAIEEGGNNGNE